MTEYNVVDFYERGKAMLASAQSSLVPRKGEYVNINKKQWKVAYVSWAVDTLSTFNSIRACVELEKVPDDETGPGEPR